MTVQLTSRVELAIEEMVATGRFADAGEVIEEAVLLLEERERGRRLRTSVAEGFAAIMRGEGTELTPRLIDDLTQEADECEREGLPLDPDLCP